MGLKQTVFPAGFLLGSAGLAMAQSTAPSTTTGNHPSPSVGTSTNPNANATGAGNAALERGANSFTEGQARRRIEDRGYTNVDQLHKDQNSIWQAETMKDGRRVRVGVDFRGNVVEDTDRRTDMAVALFDDYPEAEGAIHELGSADVPSTDVNLIANNAGNRYGNYPQYGVDRPARANHTDPGSGAGIGAVLGGGAGLLTGIGALAIPGVGPVVAAGALAATLAGAGVGAAVGGLVGALVEAGIPREHADIYAEAVRRGGTLVTVRTDDDFSDRVSDILNRHSPVDIQERAESWRQAGWRGFDERAEPYAASVSTDRPATIRPTGAGELQRDWEVRRDPSAVPPQTGRNYVRIYPPVEAPISDKR